MNIKLLKRIKRQILRNPKQFSMAHWHCGTTHCIAGWAQVLAGKAPDVHHAVWDARHALAISDEQADQLFYRTNWPKEIQDRWIEARVNHKSATFKSKIAAERIEYFIKHGI